MPNLSQDQAQTREMICPSCGEPRRPAQLRRGGEVVPAVAGEIRAAHPGWTADQAVCDVCVRDGERQFFTALIAAEKGAVGKSEEIVLDALAAAGVTTRSANDLVAEELAWAERTAGAVAVVVGSWFFPFFILLFLVIWSGLNILWRPFTPYPTILFAVISAALASLAALYGPFILMNQRYQRRHDSLRAQNDYQINLKAELEIRYLHEKLDFLLAQQEAGDGLKDRDSGGMDTPGD